jgi:outer membrane protein W
MMEDRRFESESNQPAAAQTRLETGGNCATQRMEERTMNSTNRFRFTRLTVTLVSVALLVTAASAGAADSKWQVKVGGVWVHPDLSYKPSYPVFEHIKTDSDNAIGLGLGLEYSFSDRLGLEVGALRASPNVNLRVDFPGGQSIEASDGLAFTPITAGLAVHLTPGRPLDVFVVPALAYVVYGNLRFSAPGDTVSLDVDNQWTWGISLGAEVRLGDGPWRFNGAVSYIRASLNATDIDNGDVHHVDFNPCIVTLGLGYRF